MGTQHKVYNWLNNIQHLLYPPTCLLCGAPGEGDRDLCPACHAGLPHNPLSCRLCALPLAAHEEGVCGACLRHPPPVDGSTVPFLYAPPLDHLLLGLKFNQRLVNGRLLGGLMAEAILASGTELPDAILPVPLHPARLRERGYNQALELARPLARRLQLPLMPRLALRSKATAAQSRLEQGERRRNIRGAFTLPGRVPGHIAILDDVVTTGSTVGELARALRRAGAQRVVVWACARVP